MFAVELSSLSSLSSLCLTSDAEHGAVHTLTYLNYICIHTYMCTLQLCTTYAWMLCKALPVGSGVRTSTSDCFGEIRLEHVENS